MYVQIDEQQHPDERLRDRLLVLCLTGKAQQCGKDSRQVGSNGRIHKKLLRTVS